MSNSQSYDDFSNAEEIGIVMQENPSCFLVVPYKGETDFVRVNLKTNYILAYYPNSKTELRFTHLIKWQKITGKV